VGVAWQGQMLDPGEPSAGRSTSVRAALLVAPTGRRPSGEARNWKVRSDDSSHHPRAESRQLSDGGGAAFASPRGKRTVVNIEELPPILLAIVA